MSVSSTPARRSLPLFLAALVTALIASALPRLAFKPGLPLPAIQRDQIASESHDALPIGMPLGSFSAALFFAIVGIILVATIVLVLRRVPLSQILRGIWSVLWRILILASCFVMVALFSKGSATKLSPLPLSTPRPLEYAPAGPVPAIVIWVTAILLVAAMAFLILRAALAKPEPPVSWEEEIKRARRDLREGGNLRETIIRCYASMSEILKEERGWERGSAMTTQEFEAFLTDEGLPRESVHALTRLFDEARYGRREPLEGNEAEAIACLDAILEGARVAGRGSKA
jgi:hypothetical protein